MLSLWAIQVWSVFKCRSIAKFEHTEISQKRAREQIFPYRTLLLSQGRSPWWCWSPSRGTFWGGFNFPWKSGADHLWSQGFQPVALLMVDKFIKFWVQRPLVWWFFMFPLWDRLFNYGSSVVILYVLFFLTFVIRFSLVCLCLTFCQPGSSFDETWLGARATLPDAELGHFPALKRKGGI